jgi:putative transposase
MIRTFRYPLRPTQAQEATLNAWLAACCELYNGALQHRRDAWRKQRVSVSKYSQQLELTQIRASDSEWSAIPLSVERSALRRLDLAFKGFFRRVKSEQTPGFPRFRSRDRYNSFDFGSDPIRAVGNRVFLWKLGPVRFHKYRELRGEIRTVRIHREPLGWSVLFVCELGEAPSKVPVRSAVGIDLGLETFATLSNGERVENPRFFRESAEVLARRQQSMDRKRRASSSRKRAKALVARAHGHIRNQRIDLARKVACDLFVRFDLVVHEDLEIARMVRGILAKSINDVAWGQFLRALACKAESAGKWCVPVDPRWTSQACPACGTVAKKQLSEREHRCDCGFSADRDHAAAQVILARGLRVGQLTEASGPSSGLEVKPHYTNPAMSS